MAECKQCGTCCEKGGPALHIEDKYLIMQGKLPATGLFTVRKGEKAVDPIQNKPVILEEEIIKIRGVGAEWTCVHLNETTRQCEVYESRPVECRLLKCWDNRAVLARYHQDRLTRESLFGGVEGLWDLIADHESRCSYAAISELVEALGGEKGEEATRTLGELLLYDKHIREVISEKQPAMGEMTDLLFGRPLLSTIGPLYDLRISETKDGLVIKPKLTV